MSMNSFYKKMNILKLRYEISKQNVYNIIEMSNLFQFPLLPLCVKNAFQTQGL